MDKLQKTVEALKDFVQRANQALGSPSFKIRATEGGFRLIGPWGEYVVEKVEKGFRHRTGKFEEVSSEPTHPKLAEWLRHQTTVALLASGKLDPLLREEDEVEGEDPYEAYNKEKDPVRAVKKFVRDFFERHDPSIPEYYDHAENVREEEDGLYLFGLGKGYLVAPEEEGKYLHSGPYDDMTYPGPVSPLLEEWLWYELHTARLLRELGFDPEEEEELDGYELAGLHVLPDGYLLPTRGKVSLEEAVAYLKSQGL